MKQVIILLILLCGITSVSAQKEMSIRIDDLGPRQTEEAQESEGLLIFCSPYELSFKSQTKEKDKAVKPYKNDKKGIMNNYYIIVSTLPKYKDRVLHISCAGYKTIQLPVQLKTFEVKSYYVWDRKGTIGVSDLDKNINEGTELFRLGQYDQAKDKLLAALELLDNSDSTDQDEEQITLLLDNTALCAEFKDVADDLFNSEQWLLAKDKYKEVINLNKDDRHCIDRIAECQTRYDDAPLEITGTVRKKGALIGGAVVMAVEYNRKGKEKKPDEATRAATDGSGQYKIIVQNKTKFLKCWEGMSRVKTIKITGNVINIDL